MKVELKLNGKTVAAATLVFLGIVLAMATTIARGTGAGPVNAPALVQTIVKEEDHVTPGQLAQWLIEKRTDFQLIDIREPWQFDDYHIPTAVNIPLAELFEDAGLKKLARERRSWCMDSVGPERHKRSCSSASRATTRFRCRMALRPGGMTSSPPPACAQRTRLLPDTCKQNNCANTSWDRRQREKRPLHLHLPRPLCHLLRPHPLARHRERN